MKDKRIEERIQHSLNAALSGLRTTSYQRDQFFENATGGDKVKRKLPVVAVLAAALMLLTVTAFALTKGFGLWDFVGAHEEKEIPPNAEQYTLHELGTLNTEHFTVNIREGYYDGTTIHLIYDVIPKDKGMLLLSNGPGMDESWYGITHLPYDSDYHSIWMLNIFIYIQVFFYLSIRFLGAYFLRVEVILHNMKCLCFHIISCKNKFVII